MIFQSHGFLYWVVFWWVLGLFPPPAAYLVEHDSVLTNAEASDAVTIENGEALVSQMCTGCHRDDLGRRSIFRWSNHHSEYHVS